MKRAALVIGNADYPDNPLSNSSNDAEDMAAKLESFGFVVKSVVNGTSLEMERALKDFRTEMYQADVGLFFFAGHGVQIDGTNYLLAIDSDFSSEVDAKHTSLKLDQVIETMEQAPTSTSIVILDACRNNPWRAVFRSAGAHELAPVYAPSGTLVAYATSPGQKAKDGKGRNGAYTSALLKHIHATDCSIEAMFKRVRNSLNAATDGKQISWEHTSLAGEFYFNLAVDANIDDYPPTALRDSALELDESKLSHRTIIGLKTYTWGSQNKALEGFSAVVAKKCAVRNLFVIGRNIYQAACGGANTAVSYISYFIARTKDLDEEKRKALLDGMLFEIFFDSDGKLRDTIKGECFNAIFELQRHPALAPSFDFIAKCLAPYVGRFYALPGKTDRVVVDVVLQPLERNGEVLNTVKKVFFASHDVLRPEDDDIQPGEEPESFRRQKWADFEIYLSKQLVVPLWRLAINFTGVNAKPESVRSPRGWTVKKPLP